jgi:TATA-box binding protein (TBP) (component of TFIID and TFIIIB)
MRLGGEDAEPQRVAIHLGTKARTKARKRRAQPKKNNFRLLLNNVIANADLGTPLNPEKVLRLFGGFRTRRFPAMASYFSEMNTMMLMYQSGQLLCMGATSYFHCLASARMAALVLSRALGVRITFRNFCVRNMAGYFHTGREIDLEALRKKVAGARGAGALDEEKEGEEGDEKRKKFKGYTIKPPKLNGRPITVFESGKIVAVGLKNDRECEETEEQVGFIRDFQRGSIKMDSAFHERAYVPALSTPKS